MMANAKKKTYDPIPQGEYLVKAGRFTEKATKNGTGAYVAGTFEVLEGDNAGRLIFHNFLIKHNNPKAAEIGQDQLSKYLKAVGVKGGFGELGNDVTALESYLNKALTVKVVIEKGSARPEGGMYSDRNKITGWATR